MATFNTGDGVVSCENGIVLYSTKNYNEEFSNIKAVILKCNQTITGYVCSFLFNKWHPIRDKVNITVYGNKTGLGRSMDFNEQTFVLT